MELVMKEDDFIVSKTDTKGTMTYGNKKFIEMSGYRESELLGKPHNIIRHSDMPRAVFKLLWDRVQAGEEIFAYVVNKSKNGDFYWVYANVTASYDANKRIVGFYSVRRKPKPSALEIIKPLYKKMVDAERSGGVEASLKILGELLKEQGMNYDEFIISIQK